MNRQGVPKPSAQPRPPHAAVSTAVLPCCLVIFLLALLLLSTGRSAQATGDTFFIYGDSLAPGWEVEKSRANVNLNISSPTYEGSKSMRIDFSGGDGYVRLQPETPLPAAGYHIIQFALFGNETGQELAVALLDGQGNSIQNPVVVQLPYQQWSLVEVPLTTAVQQSAIAGIGLTKFSNAGNWAPFYLDQMLLTGGQEAPTSTATATATATNQPPPSSTATATNQPAPSPTSTATNQPAPSPSATATVPGTATSDPPTSTPTATTVPPTPTGTATAVPPTPTATTTAVPPTATATSTSQPPAVDTTSIIISPAEIMDLPASGGAWQNVLDWAQQSAAGPNLADQNDQTDAVVVAKALVYVRTGQTKYRDEAVAAIMAVMGTESGSGILAIGRNLAGYVVAAGLVGLDGSDDAEFRAWLDQIRFQVFDGAGPALSIISCHEKRPNNFGTHCGTSRLAAAIYLGDDADVANAAVVFRGYLGDRAVYAGFKFGADLSWQCDPDQPVGINPAGCQKDGHVVDGVLPDDQRRGGSFTWPPPAENYVWEALQGAISQARILERQGYPAFNWSNQALLRAVTWLHEQANFPATGDDTATPYLINAEYGASFPTSTNVRPGKNGLGWYDWFYGGD